MFPHASNQARSTIIGVGGFGLFAVAHLAPRLQFVNAQRRMSNPALPDLNKLVSYALLIPRRPDPKAKKVDDRPGKIELWIPVTQNIQDIAPYEEEFRRAAKRFVERLRQTGKPDVPDRPSDAWQSLEAAYKKWRSDHGIVGDDGVFVAEVVNDALINFLESRGSFRTVATCYLHSSDESPQIKGGRVSRRDVLRSLESAAGSFGTELDYQLSAAYHDLTQPIEQETQITTYIIASATEDVAGALLWPLGHMLRDRLSDYPVETVALISTGPYSPPPYRAYEEASAYATLCEIDYLSRQSANDDGRRGGHDLDNTPYGSWRLLRESAGRPAYDRCYLLDAVKASRATAAGQEEVAVSIANAMELFMMGNGDQIVQQQLAAGLSLENRTTYSALGAAVTFLPIQKIQYWVRSRLAAKIVKERMLESIDPKPMQTRGSLYAAEQGLTLESVGQAIIADVPIAMRPARGKSTPTFTLRDASALLPPELQSTPGQRRPPRHSPVEWYRLMSEHREQLLRNERVRPLMQQSSATPTAGPPASRQLGIWRLYMHLAGGTARTIELDTTMTPLTSASGVYTAQHDQHEVVLTATTDRTAAGQQVTSARVIPYTNQPFSYLGLPITETRQTRSESYRKLMRLEESGEHDGTIVGRFESDLLRQTLTFLTGDNRGLQMAQAWLGGVLTHINKELDRLPHDDRAEQAFQEDWDRRLIALEQTLGGRSRLGGPRTRGLAQRRPENAALIARALVAGGFALFAGSVFLRRVMPTSFSLWWSIGLALAAVGGPLLLSGLFRLAYDWQVGRFRRRTLALYREQIDRQVTLSTLSAIAAAMNEAFGIVSKLFAGIDRDIRSAEAWCEEKGTEDEFHIEEQHDTILRQAIGDPDLVSEVSHMNTQEQDKMLDEIENLWQWHERPAKETVAKALKEYAARDDPPAGAQTGAAAQPQAGATQSPPPPPPPPPHIWNWLRTTADEVAGRFVKRQNRYTQNIESYIARHPRSIMGPTAENADPVLDDGSDPIHDFLINMGYLAKPYIFLEEVELSQPVVSIDLLGVGQEEQTRFDRGFLADLRSDPRWSTHPPTLVSTYDPFSITYLRTLHGLPARSMSRWGRYHNTFSRLGKTDRQLIDILRPATGYDVDEGSVQQEWSDDLFNADEQPPPNTPATPPATGGAKAKKP